VLLQQQIQLRELVLSKFLTTKLNLEMLFVENNSREEIQE
jgi:hypothetical protein